MFNAIYLSESGHRFSLDHAREINVYVRPDDIAKFEDLSYSKPSLVCDLLNYLRLGHTDHWSSLRFCAELYILELGTCFSNKPIGDEDIDQVNEEWEPSGTGGNVKWGVWRPLWERIWWACWDEWSPLSSNESKSWKLHIGTRNSIVEWYIPRDTPSPWDLKKRTMMVSCATGENRISIGRRIEFFYMTDLPMGSDPTRI